jgi:integrase
MRKKRSAGRNGMGTEEVTALLRETKDPRGKAMWMLVLLCGLRIGDLARLEEVNGERKELAFWGGGTIRLNQRMWSKIVFILRRAGIIQL